ncbi:TPA: ribosome-binding factor A [Patescibacteria group bacterium]|nr:ribosome-binding factor A [Patescibacteria group bacterium]HCU47700.1 ribosome-binding factor A [Patescibacteria group bacterium]
MKKLDNVASANGGDAKPRRLYQIESLLQHELGTLVVKMLESPTGTLVSVSSIKVTADLETAEVKLSILPFTRRQEVFKAIRGQLKEITHQLNQRLHLYRVPKLDFVIDETEERADRLGQLLDHPTPPVSPPI